MAQLTIISDPNVEVAVLVDTDEFYALPVVAVGPDREALLQAFIDSTPFDLGLLGSNGIMPAFAQFLERSGAFNPTQEQPTTDMEVGSQNSNDSDDEARLAELVANATTEVPDEQPADTDTPTDTQAEPVTVRCFNCEGRGMIEFGDGSPAMECNVCHGTGKVTQAVT